MMQTLKCRFCSWVTPRFTRLKDGTVRHGHGRLERHVEQAHRLNYEPVLKACMDEAMEQEDALERDQQREDWSPQWP